MLHLDWHLTFRRIAIHVPTATAVVADLHLGYQDARRQCGDAIPSVDVETQLAPLIARWLIARLEAWSSPEICSRGRSMPKFGGPSKPSWRAPALNSSA